MITNISKIEKGDLVIYRSGRINYVNDVYNYKTYYNDNFENMAKNRGFDIMEIKRYFKVLWFYKLKTIYKRKDDR